MFQPVGPLFQLTVVQMRGANMCRALDSVAVSNAQTHFRKTAVVTYFIHVQEPNVKYD